jgi:serine/threonine protein phosphatase PrpC
MKKPSEENPGEEGEEALNLDSIGCTANVVVIDQNLKKVFVANAGDSRCVMGVGGKCVPMSFDHKPEGPIELARI